MIDAEELAELQVEAAALLTDDCSVTRQEKVRSASGGFAMTPETVYSGKGRVGPIGRRTREVWGAQLGERGGAMVTLPAGTDAQSGDTVTFTSGSASGTVYTVLGRDERSLEISLRLVCAKGR